MYRQSNIAIEIEDFMRESRKAAAALPIFSTWSMGVSATFLLVAMYWAVMYRLTWSLDYAFLSTSITLIAGLLSSFDLFTRRKHFRRSSDKFPVFDVAVILVSLIGFSLMYTRTMAI
ncbi:MAG: hypothetical protein HQL69_01230 [Magnetococcales bacterium]|nr:hypothetical protein [Magnetococcales bacterium]